MAEFRNIVRIYQDRQKEIAAKKKKDYIKEELRRVEGYLQREKSKVIKPEVRKHFPYVFTSPYPYCSTDVARFVIHMPDGACIGKGYKSRSTAIGLCDPEIDHRMDTTSEFDLVRLPAIKRGDNINTPRDDGRTSLSGRPAATSDSQRPPKRGSTRLPKFPAVSIDSRDLATKTLYYSDVPKLREHLRERYDKNDGKKHDAEYIRTRDDIYRMDLDRFDQLSPQSRPLMRKLCFAYLQNNAGSRRAAYECLKNNQK